ncbi:MAG: glucose 1-dehydrogenase [Alphaproteobacteria bacterium]|nr:glucose 1-dehydrogenase [Alphaproteobacteria bacterium]
MARIKGKTALVTGATAGIGRAVALRLAEEGARVAVTGRNEATGQAVVAEILGAGGEATFLPLDVTEEAAWQGALAALEESFTRLDILVNNAGITMSGPIENTALEDWRRIMAVNVDGVFLGTKHAIPLMRKGGGGSIVNLSSVLGITGTPMISAYTASKAAVRLFTKCTALECAGDGIRVNSIHPAFIHTPMMEDTAIRMFGDVATGKAEFGKLHPIGHAGEPIDIANGVLYLVADESAFTTGAELVIDGGYTAA